MRRPFALVMACVLACLVLAYSPQLHAATDPTPAPGDTKLHLEACARWTEQNSSFGFTNECKEPVALLFIQLNGEHRFDRVIQPNERFETGVTVQAIDSSGWLFTVCPVGYGPNLPFTAEHQTQISRSQYECVRK